MIFVWFISLMVLWIRTVIFTVYNRNVVWFYHPSITLALLLVPTRAKDSTKELRDITNTQSDHYVLKNNMDIYLKSKWNATVALETSLKFKLSFLSKKQVYYLVLLRT